MSPPTEVGSIEAGKLADLVVWKPAFFGVKPEIIHKGGLTAMANMANMASPNASIPTPQPMFYRPQFAAHGRAKYSTPLTCVSAAGRDHARSLGLGKTLSTVHSCRHVTRPDML